MSSAFCYDAAFRRNLGLVSTNEQMRLRAARVGLAGLGGVGGAHLQTLARMGIGTFHLADMDRFEIVNFNRQLGASMQTLGAAKTEVARRVARDINPDLKVKTFDDGISSRNINAFLDGLDVVVDGIEFFAIDVHRLLHAECRKRGVPVVQAGPVGYGAAVWTFLPDGISFDEFFGFSDELTFAERVLAFSLGHSPSLFVRDVHPSKVDFVNRKAPALASACVLCAGAAATEVLKYLCDRGGLYAAPRGIYIDPYRGKVFPLRQRSSLTRSMWGRFVRKVGFRVSPQLRVLHEREMEDRKRATACVASVHV